MTLQLSRMEPRSVFELVGSNENAATFALGWVFEKSPTLLGLLLHSLGVTNQSSTAIHLQRFGEDRGFSDMELSSPDKFHIIIEAKRGWTLPTQQQLSRYCTRLSGFSGIRLMISLSAASREYARRLPAEINGVLVKHFSWSDLSNMAGKARSKTNSPIEKLWLNELFEHLKGYVMLQQVDDNLVYVVSLSGQPTRGRGSYTWIDVVRIDNCYFHPVGPGGGWPSFPPNYLGFRYGGELKSVHHIDGYEIADDLAHINPNWPDIDRSHFIYKLGPPMHPREPIRSGKIVRNTRIRCAIDTLLSGAYSTIDAARDATNKRQSLADAVSNGTSNS